MEIKKYSQLLLICAILLSGITKASGQKRIPLRSYNTIDYLKYIIASDSASFNNYVAFHAINNERTGQIDVDKNIKIATVFHVILTKAESEIAVDKLYRQLDLVNASFALTRKTKEFRDKDFRRLEKFQKKVAKSKISFCFPKKEKGVHVSIRDSIPQTYTDITKMCKDLHADSAFLNIYVINLEGSAAGFAGMPFDHNGIQGIVLNRRYIDSIGIKDFPYNEGQTLTHLIGNYLGLYPVWGRELCGDDRVDDTPIHNAPSNYCFNSEYVSTCDGNPTVMVNNFMDNAYDECLSAFTLGQVERMLYFLSQGQYRYTQTQHNVKCNSKPKDFAERDITSRNTTEYIEVYPNPAYSTIYIKCYREAAGENTYKIYDSAGKVIVNGLFYDETRIDVSGWNSGLYIVETKTEAQIHNTKILIVK